MDGADGMVEEPRPQARTTGLLFIPSAIYRPGQTVPSSNCPYDNDAIYSRIPLEWDVIVRLRGARDNVIKRRRARQQYGTLAAHSSGPGGTLGEYHVETQIEDDVPAGLQVEVSSLNLK
jgi:hypothetical protein